MKTILTVLAACFWLPSAWAVTTGFTAGNDLTATPLRGEVSVSCNENGQSDFARWSCSDTVLDPAEYSYFITDAGLDADTVTLAATWEDGKVVTKTEGYDPVTGKSKDSFNLWIDTLFQNPLLDMGANRVHYTLSKSGAVAREGDFVATIKKGAVRRCQDGHEFSQRLSDCRTTGDWVCDTYFNHQNYCQ